MFPWTELWFFRIHPINPRDVLPLNFWFMLMWTLAPLICLVIIASLKHQQMSGTFCSASRVICSAVGHHCWQKLVVWLHQSFTGICLYPQPNVKWQPLLSETEIPVIFMWPSVYLLHCCSLVCSSEERDTTQEHRRTCLHILIINVLFKQNSNYQSVLCQSREKEFQLKIWLWPGSTLGQQLMTIVNILSIVSTQWLSQ